MASPAIPALIPVTDDPVSAEGFDAVVVVGQAPFHGLQAHGRVREHVAELRSVDRALAEGSRSVVLLPAEGVPGGRLVLAATGSLADDVDDVRRFAEAGQRGLARADEAGSERPLVVVVAPGNEPRYRRALESSLLGALSSLWRPLEAREAGRAASSMQQIGVRVPSLAEGQGLLAQVRRLELGRMLARDLTGTEPERMAPEGFARLCEEEFEGSAVSVQVERDAATIRERYPLLGAVARASLEIERHRPRILRLEYKGAGPITRTRWLAGKGVTYDTGGADLKVGGHMAGMSRDKGGAGAVAGWFRWLMEEKPQGLHAVGLIGAVRNSIGADAYVTDEIIATRGQVRVRIGNTDAEGRLVLADLLSELREEAEAAPAPLLLSVATLTGHSHRAVGPYPIVIGNGAAEQGGHVARLQQVGDEWGEPFERSVVRREDYEFVKSRSAAEDLVSCNSAPSSMTARGHQFPFAFLEIASGIRKAGRATLPFYHLDIGGSVATDADYQFGMPTASPVIALSQAL